MSPLWLLNDKRKIIPSREWLLGWFEGYYTYRPKEFNHIKHEPRETLNIIYQRIKKEVSLYE